jgi:hypothetical protein
MFMNVKQIYLFGLVCVFLMWGTLGFAFAAPRSESVLQLTSTPPSTFPEVAATQPAGIPVTGEPEPVWIEILVFYGLIGLTALFLVLALLNLANKSTAPYAPRNTSPPDKPQQN